MPEWRRSLDLAASIGMLAAAVVLVTANLPRLDRRPPQRVGIVLPAEPISLDGVATRGAPSAEVAVIEFSDFQCPFCQKFAREELPTFEKEFVASGRVILAFKHLPLERIHPASFRAAESAECANRQGRFWNLHDALLGSATTLDAGQIDRLAKGLALDEGPYQSCLAGEASEVVRQHQAEARALGISSTPTFLVGRLEADGRVRAEKSLVGFQTAEALGGVVRGLLKAAR